LKFVLDESVDAPLADRLKKEGHSIVCVWEHSPGISDDEVLELTNKNQAILITADRDFGELVFRLKKANHGVILIRLSGLPIKKKVEIVSHAVNTHGDELKEFFSVITPALVRIRRI
jgi:predicted nuclease of predicted toxin-antitoxin system